MVTSGNVGSTPTSATTHNWAVSNFELYQVSIGLTGFAPTLIKIYTMEKARITVEVDGKILVKVYDVIRTAQLSKKERLHIKNDNPPFAKLMQYTNRTTRVFPEWEIVKNS